MSWEEKRVFVRTAIDVKDVKERKSVSDVQKRSNTLMFSLKGTEGRKKVCKEMILNTTGLKKWWVLNAVTAETQRPEKTQKGAQPSDGLAFVKEFLDRLPKMLSHNCRKDSNKMCLEPLFQSFADIYREYLKVCDSEGKPKMSRTVFVAGVKVGNISLFMPRKDQCDLCCEYSQCNVAEDVYHQHRERKESAQREKSRDKEMYPFPSRTILLCVDVQRVLLAPAL
ncbi:hypothetical protein RRG08_063656 [Elysia crispata]|uniref:Uncharacterized protein n=1 Tax=Elysia crispata TaxID=231223 RepID=A0AAE1A6A8_9GAST|nr:hypothetical protein RRG08_063656 [Elysia crispata]